MQTKGKVKKTRADINPILDGVRAHPILDEGDKKAPQVNSAI